MGKLLALAMAGLLSGCSILTSHTEPLRFTTFKEGPIRACIQGTGGRCGSDAGQEVKRISAGDRARFLAQLTRAGGPLHPASLPAVQALTSPVAPKIEAMFEHAAGLRDANAPAATFSGSELSRYARALHEATSLNAWASLRADLGEMVARSVGDGDKPAAESTIRQLTLIEAYLAAYFSNGEFVSLDIDATKLAASAQEQLKKKLDVSDDAAKELTSNLLKQLIGEQADDKKMIHVLVKKKEGGFVSRAGARYTFPGVTVTLDPAAEKPLQVSKVDFGQVGADVVRVVVEATGDAWSQLPADPSSTACTLKKAKQLDRYRDLRCYSEADKVSATDFTKVNDLANTAEAYAGAATGRLIRGLGWVSLNNEAVAKLIETAIAVAARKGAEKVAWCYMACKAAPTDAPTVTTVPLLVAP